jgi:Tol biopolymer transport system component
VSHEELATSVPDHLLRRGWATEVFVLNPSPGGGASAPVPFVLANPVPLLSAATPDSVRLKTAADVELAGSGFVQGSRVHLGGKEYIPVSVSPTRLVFRIPSAGPSRDGRLRVSSPAPGGGESNEITLGVQELQPAIGRTFPMALEEGGGAQAIRVTGFDFAPDAVARLGASLRSAVVVDSSTLDVQATAADAATLGTTELYVDNPRGGGASPAFDLATVPAGRIAYAFRFGPFVTSRLNGADRTEIVLDTGVDWVETWPSGDRILFTKTVGFFGKPGLFVAEPNGDVTKITTDSVGTPTLSSDASWIYFTRDGDLLRMRPDGTGTELLVAAAPAGTLLRWPDPSPAGDRVAFARYEPNASPADDLRILDLQTMQVTSLGVRAHRPRWSPDGQWIAYRSSQPGEIGVRRIRADGTGDEGLNLGPSVVTDPGGFDWSPDARYLAVMTYGLLRGGEIRLIEPATGAVLAIPPAVCDCASGEYGREWFISWFADPAIP